MLISLGTHLCYGKSLRQSALLVNWQRARCRLGQDVEELEDNPAEKHPITFGILFVGTVLQTVKIFSFQGVLWTNVWAGLYLSSFVVVALLGFLAPKDWRDNPPDAPDGRSTVPELDILSDILLCAAPGAHFFCYSWALDRIIARDLAAPPLLYLFVPLLVQIFGSVCIVLLVVALGCAAPPLLLAGILLGVNHFVGRNIRTFLGDSCDQVLPFTAWSKIHLAEKIESTSHESWKSCYFCCLLEFPRGLAVLSPSI
jgi:hypothetical protein